MRDATNRVKRELQKESALGFSPRRRVRDWRDLSSVHSGSRTAMEARHERTRQGGKKSNLTEISRRTTAADCEPTDRDELTLRASFWEEQGVSEVRQLVAE